MPKLKTLAAILVLILETQCRKCCSFSFSPRSSSAWNVRPPPQQQNTFRSRLFLSPLPDEDAIQRSLENLVQLKKEHPQMNRRNALQSTLAGTITCIATSSSSSSTSASAADSSGFAPAVRPTAYRVDSTIPPTLLPVPNARSQLALLRDLGKGLGTDKEAVFIDRLNLNNMLQKAVYGTANVVSNIGKGSSDTQAPASFVCLGLPTNPSARDFDLIVSLLQSTWGPKSRKMAIGIALFPYPSQSLLDDFISSRLTMTELEEALQQPPMLVSREVLSLYAPLLSYAAAKQIPLVALGLDAGDRRTVRQQGLQNVDPATRALYVADPNGFIATTTDPAFKVYTDRSLLKDFSANNNNNNMADTSSDTAATAPSNGKTGTGIFFAERILAHEAAATLAARYAVQNGPGTVMAVVAPINDVRYLNGINGRLPRVYQYQSTAQLKSNNDKNSLGSLSPPQPNSAAPVTANDVTTILVNPTAADTLSRTVRLRLEIGTGPETLPYQTKIADYLWFSSSPAVSLLPRVMDY